VIYHNLVLTGYSALLRTSHRRTFGSSLGPVPFTLRSASRQWVAPSVAAGANATAATTATAAATAAEVACCCCCCATQRNEPALAGPQTGPHGSPEAARCSQLRTPRSEPRSSTVVGAGGAAVLPVVARVRDQSKREWLSRVEKGRPATNGIRTVRASDDQDEPLGRPPVRSFFLIA
jgi:hypothetical protein